MKVSAAGRDKITAREGRRLEAYQDSVGVWTIGVGHTGRMSPGAVYRGMTISTGQCDAYLAADLAPVEAALNKAIKVPVTQNEFDALASWLFNVGTGWAKPPKTATCIKLVNLGDMRGAADALLRFNKPPEIQKRRSAERAQFLAPDLTSISVAAARPIVLGDLADNAKGNAVISAGTATASGAAMVIAGAAAASGAHPTATASIAGVSFFATILSGLWAWWKGSEAKALAANADQAWGSAQAA